MQKTQGVTRVLVVDDSAYMRKVLRDMLEKSVFIEVVDTARNGQEALEKAAELQPDVIFTDLIMPDMDGLAFIREQMKRRPLPIVVCSSVSAIGGQVLAAMEAGAVEFVQKPTALALDSMYTIQREVVEAVQNAAAVSFKNLVSTPSPEPVEIYEAGGELQFSQVHNVDAVLIGLSTGGPRALRAMLPRLPRNIPVAICIVLHMPIGYTLPMAQKLNDLCEIEVLESAEGLDMKPGRAILAQAGKHTRLYRAPSGEVQVTLSQVSNGNLYCPSVDELFRSGAEVYGSRVLGLIMTGMGNDGTAGAGWIKAQGGLVYAEAEESSIIFGMPRSAIEAGLVDRVVSLNDIPKAILEAVV